ncbi:hypothetical protein E8E13_011183 [Curvularia kusanoi]|uniref:Uncharacterized protein n=1 Tax=Curvularia kusanoi TaxID=90978 RepID=A0A9P4TLQ0_CURKU|nr:hypothetical protein E8E13_011183 [Curvularia kusanoi]
MPPLRRSSLNIAFDPREPTPNVEVTTTIATRTADTAPNDDQPQSPQSCRATQATSRNTISSIISLPATPDRPLTHAPSSGSQTETPVKQGRKISTTITDADVKKWMEKGTYGNEVLRKSIFDTTQDAVNAGQTQRTNLEGEGGAADVGTGTSAKSA